MCTCAVISTLSNIIAVLSCMSQVSAYPGEGFSVGVELYDELGELTADVLRLSDETLSLQQSKAALLQVSTTSLLRLHRCLAIQATI